MQITSLSGVWPSTSATVATGERVVKVKRVPSVAGMDPISHVVRISASEDVCITGPKMKEIVGHAGQNFYTLIVMPYLDMCRV